MLTRSNSGLFALVLTCACSCASALPYKVRVAGDGETITELSTTSIVVASSTHADLSVVLDQQTLFHYELGGDSAVAAWSIDWDDKVRLTRMTCEQIAASFPDLSRFPCVDEHFELVYDRRMRNIVSFDRRKREVDQR